MEQNKPETATFPPKIFTGIRLCRLEDLEKSSGREMPLSYISTYIFIEK
jgi:hypothetical protein